MLCSDHLISLYCGLVVRLPGSTPFAFGKKGLEFIEGLKDPHVFSG